MTNENYHEATVTEAGTVVVSEVGPDELMGSVAFQEAAPFIQRQLASWAEDIRQPKSRKAGMFSRDKYVTPGDVHGQMALAYDSAEDDVISGVLETSESVAFQKISFESENKDQEDIWNQVAADLDLDSFVRTSFRELNLVSVVYPVRWWGQKKYTVRGKGEGGRAKRKTFNLTVPVGLGFMDPTRIVPVNGDLFGGTQLAWMATDDEMDMINDDGGDLEDQLTERLFLRRYTTTQSEEKKLEKEKVDVDRLILLNPEFVYRHTLT